MEKQQKGKTEAKKYYQEPLGWAEEQIKLKWKNNKKGKTEAKKYYQEPLFWAGEESRSSLSGKITKRKNRSKQILSTTACLGGNLIWYNDTNMNWDEYIPGLIRNMLGT